MNRLLRLCVLVSLMPAWARAESITVSAAVSLREVLGQIGNVYTAQTGTHIDFNFAASGPLATQIEQGAPVDLFISAADKQVKQLIADGKADGASRSVVARNSLVLIIPGTADALNIGSFADLSNVKLVHIAMGQPQSVPAGMYAQQTLDALKLSDAVKPKLVYGISVRQVLDYVVRNEADAGIVYRTDALEAQSAVKIVATADESTHERIEYPAVVIRNAAHADAAKAFEQFLLSNAAQTMFAGHGFVAVSNPATQSTTLSPTAASPAAPPSVGP